jgi:hypothetical protein
MRPQSQEIAAYQRARLFDFGVLEHSADRQRSEIAML